MYYCNLQKQKQKKAESRKSLIVYAPEETAADQFQKI